MPSPGLLGDQTPLAWYDSVAVGGGSGAAWRGFGAGLVAAQGLGEIPADGRARAVVDLRSGDFGYDENSLAIERGDSTRWLRGESFGGNRGAVGGLGSMGRHRWGVTGGLGRRGHRLEGTYAERGEAGSLSSGEGQDAKGESGSLEYRYRRRALDLGVTLARGHDLHKSCWPCGAAFGEAVLESRRDAQEVMASVEAQHTGADQRVGARLEWRRAHVTRDEDPDFDSRTTALWGAARYRKSLGEGVFEAEIGAGHQQGFEGVRVAPGLSYTIGGPAFRGRLAVERALEPVWADLALDQPPFMQRTWMGAIEVEAGGSRAKQARLRFLVGRTGERAILSRWPLEDLWMRIGVWSDPARFDFGLLSGEARWLGKRFGAGGEGFVLARDRSPAQPLVDPGYGASSFAEFRFSGFQRDLGVTLRTSLAAVGPRESQGDFQNGYDPAGGSGTFFAPRDLPGYVTIGASAILTLADAVLTVRVRNLEDRQRPEIWLDTATGTELLGPGREWRTALTVRLMN